MTNYQNTFNNLSLSAIDPAATITQESLPNLFAGVSSDLNPTMIDDWLADELCKSGLVANAFDLFNGKQDLFSSILPQTPLTASPPNSAISDSGSSHAFSPVNENLHTQSQPQISLFPDIPLPSPSSSLTDPAPLVAPAASKPVSKGALSLPRIAPRPSTLLPSDAVSVIQPPKRRLDTSKDSDEIALKRQKNTDAARRSRLKKLVKMEALENRVSELESDNNALTTRIAVLESEKSSLKSKDVSLEERIRVLEAQLAEAHKALTKV